MCEHHEFYADVKIARTTSEDGSVVTGYYAHTKINCTQCGQSFEFVGVEGGVSPFGPRVSIEGTELRAPIRPATGQLIFQEDPLSKAN